MGERQEVLRRGQPRRILGLGIALLLLIPLLLLACRPQEQAMSLEEQAAEIDKALICPICPNETLDTSQTELAQQMRQVIRTKLAAGESKEQVIQYFVDRYGEMVLAAPKKQGFSLMLWVVPVPLLAAGAAILYFVLRGWRRGARTPEAYPPMTPEQMEEYKKRVKEELGGKGA